MEEGVGADPAKFQKAVKVADKLGERIAKTTDKIMEMRNDIDGKQVLYDSHIAVVFVFRFSTLDVHGAIYDKKSQLSTGRVFAEHRIDIV